MTGQFGRGVGMASRNQILAGDSSTAVSISRPDDHEKELEESNKDLEKSAHVPGNGHEASDDTQTAAVTDWDGPNDPGNPQTWSALKKVYHVLVPTILGFVV